MREYDKGRRAKGEFKRLYVSSDPIEVDLLEQRLRSEGLTVRVQGVRHAAAIGAAPHIFDITVEVPEEQLEEAVAIAEEFLDPPDSDSLDEQRDAGLVGELPEELRDDLDGSDDASVVGGAGPDSVYLNPAIAGLVGALFLGFGAGHTYARRPLTGLLILIGQLVAVVGLSDAPEPSQGLLFGGLLFCDSVGAVMAARAWNRGIRAPVSRQLMDGLAFVLLFGAVALVLGPRF